MFRDLPALFKAHRHSREVWSPREALLGRDRRLFHRIARELDCRVDSRLYGLESAGRVVNLSLGGMSLVAPVSWPEGSQIRVFIESMDFDVSGIICFRMGREETEAGFRYGIKFEKISVRRLLQLRGMLRESYEGPLAIGG